VTVLRVYLYQPSPRWAGINIALRNVTLYSSGTLKQIRQAMLSQTGALHGEQLEEGMEWEGDGLSTPGGSGGGGVGSGGGRVELSHYPLPLRCSCTNHVHTDMVT